MTFTRCMQSKTRAQPLEQLELRMGIAEQEIYLFGHPPQKPSPPQGQGREDRRVMIRLRKDHEVRKTDSFLLRQQIQKLIPDPTLVSDAWHAPSGITILAPSPAKAAAILQY
ncbi:putative effector protein [Erysiphe necator]|uniref:Putative effector protein n=1 Tax=Uncinula necator TaxID=52586 RepID=A0A0B1NZM3_UNCNE|nr:putative effector protein [Erysiphe necator]